jgi:hypothetical protein
MTTCCSCSRTARTLCVRACVIKHSLIYGPLLFKFAVNILQITTSSMGYVLFMFTHRAHTLKHSLIFGRILFKFAGHILQMTTRYMGYILIMFTHRGHTRGRACAGASVINCSLIYGRFLFTFVVNILHITISSKGYVLFMFTHHTHACERECEIQIWWVHTTNDHMLYIGIHTYHVRSLRACVRACVCERACANASIIKRSLVFKRILFKFGGDIQQIPKSYMRYLICVWMHVLTARTCLHSRICQAHAGQWLVLPTYHYCVNVTPIVFVNLTLGYSHFSMQDGYHNPVYLVNMYYTAHITQIYLILCILALKTWTRCRHQKQLSMCLTDPSL